MALPIKVNGWTSSPTNVASTSNTVTFSPGANHALVVWIFSTAAVSIISDGTNTFYNVQGALTGGLNVALYTTGPRSSKAGTNLTITVTFASSCQSSIAVTEWSGVVAFGGNGSQQGTSTTPTYNIQSTTNNNNVIECGFGVIGTQTWSATGSTTLDLQEQGASGGATPGFGVMYNSSPTPAAVGVTGSISSSGTWIGIGIEYRSEGIAVSLGGTSSSDTTSSTTRTIGSAHIVADATVIISCVAGGGGGGHITNVTDTLGNIYAPLAPYAFNTASDVIDMWGCLQASKGGITTITITLSAASTSHAAFQEYTGVTCFGANNVEINTLASLSLSQTTVDNNNFVVFAGGAQGTSDYTVTSGTARWHVPGASSTVPGILIMDNMSASPASVTGTATITSSALEGLLSVELRTGGTSWSIVNKGGPFTPNSGVPVTLGFTPTSGNLLIAAILLSSYQADILKIIDNGVGGGSVWKPAGDGKSVTAHTDAVTNAGSTICFAQAKPGITILTFTTTDGTQVSSVEIYEVSGLKNQVADVFSGTSSATGNGTLYPSGKVFTPKIGEFIVNTIFSAQSLNSIDSDFLVDVSGTKAFAHSAINFGLPRIYNATWTSVSNSQPYCSFSAAFAPGSGTPSQDPQQQLLLPFPVPITELVYPLQMGAGDNGLFCAVFTAPFDMLLGKATIEVTTTIPSSTGFVGIYSSNGNTLITECRFDTSIMGKQTVTPQHGVGIDNLIAGTTYWFVTGNTSNLVRCQGVAAVSGEHFLSVFNANRIHAGFSTNVIASGALPATLGPVIDTIYVSPLVLFES